MNYEDELKRLEEAHEQLINKSKPKPEKKPWNQRRKRLKPASDKYAKELRKYATQSKEWLKGKSCQLCGSTENLSVHHSDGRGKNLNCKPTWRALCLIGSETWLKDKFPDANHSHSGGCHGFVEANKSIAKELNLTV